MLSLGGIASFNLYFYNSAAMRGCSRLLTVITSLLMVVSPALAQQDGRYYSETGHTLDARFVGYYDDHGGLEILGYPITAAFVDPLSGFLIQYTQNARLEYVPGRPGNEATVKLRPLGELLGGWEAALPRSQLSFGGDPGCRFYPESGHNVCHAFLDYYESHGGPWLFGYPISEFRLENDRIVQYFQGFRLDWHPDSIQGHNVQVAPLGRVHFEVMGYESSFLEPEMPGNLIEYRVVQLRPSVSVRYPVLGSSATQEVYVVVRDQNFRPVERAAVTVFATFGNQERVLLMPITDENGMSKLSLSFEDQRAGSRVFLEFLVIRADLQATARDSFWIWW